MRIFTAILFIQVIGLTVSLGHDFTGNPILPGYLANPSVIESDGHFYIYGTVKPNGDSKISYWESQDFINWTNHRLS